MSDDLERTLARAQAYNKTLTIHVMSIIETTKAAGPPNASTLIAACECAIRAASSAGEQAGGATLTSMRGLVYIEEDGTIRQATNRDI